MLRQYIEDVWVTTYELKSISMDQENIKISISTEWLLFYFAS